MKVMIETLQQLCVVLSRPSVTVQDVSASLGKNIEDHGGNLPLIVQPFDPFFEEAVVVRKYGTQEPAHVRLKIAESMRLSVQELKNSFGEYRELRKQDWDSPVSVIFGVDMPNSSHTCAILVDVALGERGIEDGTALSVIVRRDIKLD